MLKLLGTSKLCYMLSHMAQRLIRHPKNNPKYAKNVSLFFINLYFCYYIEAMPITPAAIFGPAFPVSLDCACPALPPSSWEA